MALTSAAKRQSLCCQMARKRAKLIPVCVAKIYRNISTGGDDDDDAYFKNMQRHEEIALNIKKKEFERLFKQPSIDNQHLLHLMQQRWGKIFYVQLLNGSNHRELVFELCWQYYGDEAFPFEHYGDYMNYLQAICHTLTINGFSIDVERHIMKCKDTPYAIQGLHKKNIRFVLTKDSLII
jgi:hypothetical protein